MFHSARITLTVWYILIITMVSFTFSVIIYSNIDHELERIKHFQEVRIEHEQGNTLTLEFPRRLPPINPQDITDVQNRIKLVLLLINMGIIGLSGIAAYFLAGKTLRPIKEMVEEQDRFITDASHELRTPLTALRSEIEVNIRDKHLTLKMARELLHSNLEEVVSLQTLSDSLMELAQYEKKNDGFKMEEIDIQEVLKKSIEKVSVFSRSKQIAIQYEAMPHLIKGNTPSLVELFVILLDNAIKYSKPETTIEIAVKNMRNSLSILVKDHGIGIPTEDIPNIFDRFYRADTSRTKEQVKGYGLGLSIAKTIVKMHKGTIRVESVVDTGSTFIVQLPN